MEENVYKKKMVSVIIPVYNTEQYLRDCIESVIHQTYKDLEIILIDDGSTDESGKICDAYAVVDNRIKVIHQENKGLVFATNLGISCASGEYVAFVDSDDWIDAEMYATMIENIGDCDLISTLMVFEYYESDDSQILMTKIPEGVYVGENQMKEIRTNLIGCQREDNYGIPCSRSAHLFRKRIVDKIYMERNTNVLYGEDRIFVLRYLLECNSVRMMHKAFYHYRMRSGSCTHSVDKNFLSNISGYYVELEKVCREHPLQEVLLSQLEAEVVDLMNYAIDYKLGFQYYRRAKYKLPFEIDIFKDKKIVLYAAGRVGKDYYNQLEKSDMPTQVRWVDREYEQYKNDTVKIESVESIREIEFDYVVIAVKRELLAMDIKNSLIELGVGMDKVLWKEPIQIR